jgi:hypothetical protein
MKKFVLALSTLLFTAQVYAAATIRLPIFIEDDKGPIPVAEINKELAAIGAPAIPEYLEVSTSDKAYDKIEAFKQKAEETLKTLGTKYEYAMVQGGLFPGAIDTAEYFTCYKGNALEVPALVQSMSDIYYSDQMTVWAYKYKNTTEYLNETDDDAVDFINSESPAWKNWKGQNEDLLILSAVTDGGDDVQESLIQKCQK